MLVSDESGAKFKIYDKEFVSPDLKTAAETPAEKPAG